LKTYQEAIDWLFKQFPAYQHIGEAAYKADLSNIISLCEQLEIDYQSLKFIHVAGTNGKGSTCNMLSSALKLKRYKTGLFTSPHIHDFRERIRINDDLISEQRVIDFCNSVQENKWNFKPSFFEITWALALIYFLEQQCDICVIETGLGGRLDSTNIITPILCVITNISLDHVSILGDTLDKIAFEKAGIIKKDVPVVIGETTVETKPVFILKAKECHSEIIFAEDQVLNKTFFHQANSYQYKNERTVRTAFDALDKLGFQINEQEITKAIQEAQNNPLFHGRFEIVSQEPLIIMDVAHNEAGIKEMLATLKGIQRGKLHLIYGASSDKDLRSIIKLLPKDAQFYFSEFQNERTAKIDDLKLISESLNLNSNYFHQLSDALQYAQLSVNKTDTILMTGSFFLISDYFKNKSK
jgi:dihydrofolate synthase/folylpolyglutamate synthase